MVKSKRAPFPVYLVFEHHDFMAFIVIVSEILYDEYVPVRREFCDRSLHGSLTESSERKGITVKKEENPEGASIGDDALTGRP